MPRRRRLLAITTSVLALAGLASGLGAAPALADLVSGLAAAPAPVAAPAAARAAEPAAARAAEPDAARAAEPAGEPPAKPTTRPAAEPTAEPRCVSRAALDRVEVGTTLRQAKRLLADRAVWWGPERGVWSQSFPKACSSTRAMLIQADDGRVTYVVNAGERRDPRCTTFAEFDRLRDGMPRAEAERLLRGKQFDLRRSGEWQPVPCQGWSTMQVRFRGEQVASHVRGFYFG